MQTDTRLIYSLVARGRDTVLASHALYTGNFAPVAQQVLRQCNLTQ